MNNNNPMRTIEHGMVKIEDTVLFLELVILTASILIQIVCRYILKVSSPWCEELARMLFVTMTYIGSGRAFINDGHISIDLMYSLIDKHAKDPVKAKKTFDRISSIVTEIFIILFGVIYFQYLGKMSKRPQLSAAMHINMMIPMSFVFIGIILMAIHMGCRMFYAYNAQTDTEKEEN